MSESARSKFIDAGIKLYAEVGYHKLSVRLLATEAGLSSGMFHHLFANKEEFVMEMLHHHDDVTFGQLDLNIEFENPFERLSHMVFLLAANIRDNLIFVHRLLTDSADNIDLINRFIRLKLEGRLEMLTAVLEDCSVIDNSIPASAVQRLSYLSGAVTAPMVVSTRFNNMGLLPDKLSINVDDILSNEAIKQRIEWSIKAIFPQAFLNK